jgi:eukaryotic translation initiation factor 2C
LLPSFEDVQLRQALQSVKEKFSEGRKKIVLLLLEASSKPLYQFFKDLADREFGLHALCITEGKVFKGDNGPISRMIDQYLGNVMMKVNLKCEGINHSAGDSVANSEQSLQNRLKDTTVLGADVTHPSLISIEGCPFIASLVGSVDGQGGKFLGSMRLQNPDRTDREVSKEILNGS